MSRTQTAYDHSVKLLSKRDYSRFKLRQKLLAKGHGPEDVEEAIEKVVQQKYLREEEYARIRVKTLMLNGHANKAIIHRLEAEELPVNEEFINAIRVENGMETGKTLKALLEKKVRDKGVPEESEARMKLQNKLLSHLCSKGYDLEEAKEAIRDFLHERARS